MRTARAWPAACALIGALAAALWFAGEAWPAFAAWTARELALDPAGWIERPWTLWSASLVHLSLAHLAGNLTALGAFALLGFAWRLPRSAVVALLLAWPASSVLLLLIWPEVDRYQGLSMLDHAMALLCWSFGAINGVAKPWTFVLFAGVGLKLLSEHAWSRPVAFDADWGFSVVYAAHLAGATAGAAVGCAVAAFDRRRAIFAAAGSSIDQG